MTTNDSYGAGAVNPAGEIVRRYRDGQLPFQSTFLSTGTTVGVLIKSTDAEGTIRWVSLGHDVPSIQNAITSLWEAGFRFTVSDVSQTYSVWQDLLGSARNILVSESSTGNPSPSKIIQSVIDAGNALNNQLDEDTGARAQEGIPSKLRAIGLENLERDLFEKYENLNPFFNVTKHRERLASQLKRAQMEGPDGWMIAMDYFESVRRIFLWYYKQKAATPKWKELEAIDCSAFPTKYAFDISKRW